jgi:hypothetical protein
MDLLKRWRSGEVQFKANSGKKFTIPHLNKHIWHLWYVPAIPAIWKAEIGWTAVSKTA